MYRSELNQTTNNSRISSSRLRFDEKMTETPKIEFGMECRIAYDLCCCCLSGGHLTNMSGPYEGTGTTESYFALINRCYNTEVIAPEEPLNRYNICVKCTQRLVDSYLFKCQVIKVQRALKGFLDEFAIKTDQNVDVKILDQTIPTYLEEDNNSAFGDDPDMDAEDSEPIGRLVKAASLKKTLVTPLKKRRKRSDESFKHCHPEIYAAMDFAHKRCLLCQKRFINDHTLRQHMNEHFPNHTCEQCGKGFATKRRCMAHQRCHKKNPLKCSRCDKTFDTGNQLNNHARKHRNRPSYVCPRCKERFNTFYSRQKHLRDAHNDSRERSCKFCDYTCLTSGVLDSHIKVNHSMRVRSQACHLCTKEFYDRSTLKSHLLVHSNLKTLKCCECNKLFLRKANLVQHMKHHSDTRDYICSECGQEFVQKCSLKWHLKKHEKDTLYERLQHCHPEIHAAMDFEKGQCRLCLKTFLGDHILRQHMNEHFPNHICEECGKGFATRRRCKAHQRCHKNDDLLKCSRCEKTFDTRNKLNNHQRDHTKGTLYKCPICKERFYTHYSRRKHLRDVHGDTRKFSCKMCDYTCLTGFVLSKHVRVNHSQRIRAHPCHLCTKEFYDRSTLKSHLLVHSNLRTYKCCECNKSFIRKTNLAQHMRHHSNIRDFVCSQCGQAFIQKTSLKWHLRKHEREDKIVQ